MIVCSAVHMSTWAGRLKGSVDIKTSESTAASATYRLLTLALHVITRCSSCYNKSRLCCVLLSDASACEV